MTLFIYVIGVMIGFDGLRVDILDHFPELIFLQHQWMDVQKRGNMFDYLYSTDHSAALGDVC